jgi:hypothetical protein
MAQEATQRYGLAGHWQLTHQFLLAPDEPTSWAHYAIESGLATYFACSYSNDPIMGGGASDTRKALLPPQDLRNRRRLKEIVIEEWASVQHDGSEIWGGIFWQVRKLAGPAIADRLLADTWHGFSPADEKGEKVYRAFAQYLLNRSESIENGALTERLRAVFEERGLRL